IWIVKKKLAKLQEAMGFQVQQTSHSTKRKSHPASKANEDSNDAHDQSSLIPGALNLTNHILTNTKLVPPGYDSWVVSTKLNMVK
ncbi:hypothetical protein, partial [Bacillus cereus]|uniref:hypothetical protein n=1 Tax=Bacillus cereus TaxID=1396 RepID=UPI0034D4416F